MSFCTRCGSELDPGSAFCKSCGAPAGEAPAAAPQAPEQAAYPPAAEAPPVQPPQAPAQPLAAPTYGQPVAPSIPPARGKGKGKAILFTVLGLAAAAAVVVLLLGFAVGPKWFAGGGEGPEKTVEKFFKAMEKGDAKTLVSLIDPTSLKRMKDLVSEYYDTVEDMFEDYYTSTFPEKDLKITGLQFKTEVKGDRATVTVVAGQATYTDAYGDKVTETVDDPEEVFGDNQDFDLKKVDGTWYLVPNFD